MRPSRPTRGLPTSRAYWELKAEQMMNRVFSPDGAIDLEPLPADGESPRAGAAHRPLPPAAPAPPPPRAARVPVGSPPLASAPPQRRFSDLTVLLAAMVGGVGLVGAFGAVLLVQQWAGLQRNISQERNLLLVERLRALGPAAAPSPAPPALPTPAAPALDPLPAGDATAQPPADAPTREVASFDGLPPPPPEEPWMAQLATLPASGARAPIRVPLSPRLTAAAPAALPSPAPSRRAPASPSRPRPSGPLPQLVGLVGAPGRAGSAIFQVGPSAMTVGVGEPIGGSGWLLRAADAESAVIERDTEVRRITIAGG